MMLSALEKLTRSFDVLQGFLFLMISLPAPKAVGFLQLCFSRFSWKFPLHLASSETSALLPQLASPQKWKGRFHIQADRDSDICENGTSDSKYLTGQAVVVVYSLTVVDRTRHRSLNLSPMAWLLGSAANPSRNFV
jgi:hypothetical protein